MSSNSTVIPGLNGQYQPTPNNNGINPGYQTFSPQQTVIPGVQSAQMPQPAQAAPKGQVFGFLFSVSKTMAGEYWPLMLGANTLGRSAENSIVLGEATVSESHASIHVISRSNKLIVYIKDDQSKTGTLLNGDLLRGEADLKSGDVITIGECYELYVVLINAVELGLGEKSSFASSGPAAAPMAPSAPFIPGAQPGMPNPFAQAPKMPVASGTVVEGQSGAVPMGGHTVIMGGPKF